MGDTNAAAMATLFGEWFEPEAHLDYPVGGSAAVVEALVRGLKAHGGSLHTGVAVQQLQVDGDRIVGVTLADGTSIHAQQVICNADIWSSLSLLPESVAPKWQRRQATPACNGFLHLHLGFDATGLEDLPIHTVWVDDWERGIDAERNAVVVSIPSVLDPGMAPPGRHVLHAYTPASEPWELWADLDRNSAAYQRLKQERCAVFWRVLERRIPDIRDRCELTMEGTPLTHSHYLRVHQGSYGPALSAAEGLPRRDDAPRQFLAVRCQHLPRDRHPSCGGEWRHGSPCRSRAGEAKQSAASAGALKQLRHSLVSDRQRSP